MNSTLPESPAACPKCEGTNTRAHCWNLGCTWITCPDCKTLTDLRKVKEGE